MERINERRAKALLLSEERGAFLAAQCGEYAEIKKRLSGTWFALAQQVLKRGNTEAELNSLMEENLQAQERIDRILAERGYDKSWLEPVFVCKHCEDTGFVGGKVCECLKQMIRNERYERLNAVTPLKLSTFDTFSLDLYSDKPDSPGGLSPRLLMSVAFEKCRKYAESFSKHSPNLLLQGGVGLGKTHLSLAIAKTAIDKNFGVLYGAAGEFLTKIEREHFGRSTSGEDTLSMCKSCDLLILDDLGAEFLTQFSIAMLYDIINARILSSSPTIISTNLTISGIQERYTERLASRITGNYLRYQFAGKDLRITVRKARKE
jgi:DNA replication protein DnaC